MSHWKIIPAGFIVHLKKKNTDVSRFQDMLPNRTGNIRKHRETHSPTKWVGPANLLSIYIVLRNRCCPKQFDQQKVDEFHKISFATLQQQLMDFSLSSFTKGYHRLWLFNHIKSIYYGTWSPLILLDYCSLCPFYCRWFPLLNPINLLDYCSLWEYTCASPSSGSNRAAIGKAPELQPSEAQPRSEVRISKRCLSHRHCTPCPCRPMSGDNGCRNYG